MEGREDITAVEEDNGSPCFGLEAANGSTHFIVTEPSSFAWRRSIACIRPAPVVCQWAITLRQALQAWLTLFPQAPQALSAFFLPERLNRHQLLPVTYKNKSKTRKSTKGERMRATVRHQA